MVTIDGVPVAEMGVYINLAHRPERRAFMEWQFEKRGIRGVERFEGLYADESPRGTSRDGSRKTHLAVMRRIVDEGVKSCLILEDDVELLDSFTHENLIEASSLIEADLVWIGGIPQHVFRHSSRFCLSIAKAHAFGSLVKPSFARVALELAEMGGLGEGSADSMYCACSFGSRPRFDTIRRMFEDPAVDKLGIIERLAARQFFYHEPLVASWDEAVSDNVKGLVNGKFMSGSHNISIYREKVATARPLESYNGTSVEMSYNLRELL